MITFLLVILFYLTFLNFESKHKENVIKFPDEMLSDSFPFCITFSKPLIIFTYINIGMMVNYSSLFRFYTNHMKRPKQIS